MLTLLTMGPLLAVAAPIIPLPQDGLSVIESVSESISYSYFGVMVESSFRDNETIFVPASEVADAFSLEYSHDFGGGLFAYGRLGQGWESSTQFIDGSTVTVDESTNGLGLGLGYHFEPADDWSLFGTAGFGSRSSSADWKSVDAGGDAFAVVDTDLSGLDLEVGARWRATEQLEWFMSYSVSNPTGDWEINDAVAVQALDLEMQVRRLNLGLRAFFSPNLAGVIQLSQGADERQFSIPGDKIDADVDVDVVRFGL
ncbi:MAG: outer membrane beta-barrel protein, partial [Planctomycetota bacterium]|nr:outer membrane beta-barrel protein [Planctomycetota bacterium]